MNKFKVGQQVYILDGKEGVIIRKLPNENYLIDFCNHGLSGKFKENLIFESKSELQRYKNDDADRRLSKLKVLKDYVSKYDIGTYKYTNEINRVFFSNGRMAYIYWSNDISKFLILPADSNGNFDYKLLENVHSEFDAFDGSIICDTESEIIDVLEIVRTAIPFEDLKAGDLFKAYIEYKKEWQSFIIVKEIESTELRVVNLSVGTYWKMNDPDNYDLLRYVLKLGTIHKEKIAVQISCSD